MLAPTNTVFLPGGPDGVTARQYDRLPPARATVAAQMYTLWASLQKIATADEEHDEQHMAVYYSRIMSLYSRTLLDHLTTLEAPLEQLHYSSQHMVVSLTALLYTPTTDPNSFIAEQFLDWLNTVAPAPSTAAGLALASKAAPWLPSDDSEEEPFWMYIYRCTLRGHILSASSLLGQLAGGHPSTAVQSATETVLEALKKTPRSTSYSTEQAFDRAWSKWRASLRDLKDRVEAAFAAAEDESDEQDEEELLEIEAALICLTGILQGDETRVFEASDDWKEGVAASLIWVHPTSRRGDIPETVRRALAVLPLQSAEPDVSDEPEQEADRVLLSLTLGEVPSALQQCYDLSDAAGGGDPWLVAHLADIFDKLDLIPDEDLPLDDPTRFPAGTLRDYFVLAYADTLLTIPSFWRVAVDYYSSCTSTAHRSRNGGVGRERMRAVVLSVPLLPATAAVEVDPKGKGKAPQQMDEDEETGKADEMSPVEEVLRICAEHGLEEEAVQICHTYAEAMIQEKKFGEALAYIVRARGEGAARRVARIADLILEDYVDNGYETFIAHVDSIPTSLLQPYSSTASTLPEFSSSRLSFLARYRDFFALVARGEVYEAATLLVLLFTSQVAPKKVWGILFLDVLPLLQSEEHVLISQGDTFELMRCLEEILAPVVSSPGGSRDVFGHLELLARLVDSQKKVRAKGADVSKERTLKAVRQLELVRDALATNLARTISLPR